jgi:hypothetical protein
MTGVLAHGAGTVARFSKNRLVACSGNWDVELSGQHLTFRVGKGAIVLRLALQPHELAVEQLAFVWPSGLSLTINHSGDLFIDNLHHTGLGNTGQRWTFRGNTIKASGAGRGGSPRLVHLSGHVADLTMDSNVILSSSGVADFSSLANVEDFISADMLATS